MTQISINKIVQNFTPEQNDAIGILLKYWYHEPFIATDRVEKLVVETVHFFSKKIQIGFIPITDGYKWNQSGARVTFELSDDDRNYSIELIKYNQRRICDNITYKCCSKTWLYYITRIEGNSRIFVSSFIWCQKYETKKLIEK